MLLVMYGKMEGYCECGEMDPCCSAGRLSVTILPKVLYKSPAVLGAPHLTATWGRLATRRPLGTACGVHWLLPESFTTSLWPVSADIRGTVPSLVGTAVLSAVVAGQWEFWKDEASCVTWNDLGLRVRKPASALVTEWVTCS